MKLIRTGLAPLLLSLALAPAWAQQPAPEAKVAERLEQAHAAEDRARAQEEAHRVRVEAAQAYQEALRAAEKDQRAALEAVESARRELEARAQESYQQALEAERAVEAQHAISEREMQHVQRELQRAHENLRRASREVARVHREINRPHPAVAPGYSYRYQHGDRAVIGVILGESTDTGVPVLGVSPDGPAERAGLTQGDVIVAIMETPLSGGEEDARDVLGEVMDGVKVGDELVIAVERDGEVREYTVIPERREPFSWHSVTRLGSVDDMDVLVERIEVPEIDTEALERDLARLRKDLERTRVEIDAKRVMRFSDGDSEYVYELDADNFSGFGDAVLAGSNVWFGMPLVRGLKMAEIEPGLGEYFETDRGVLVLRAREDNELQLRTGDVILAVGDTEVNKPSDVMRALRNLETGTVLDIHIKRERKDQTLAVEVPEQRVGFNFHFHEPREAPQAD